MTNQQGMGIDENGAVRVRACAKSFVTEASGDFTLPDYQSEIRRVLRVFGTALPPSAYAGADSVEFNGTLDYQLIYIGADGGIYSAPLSGEYGFFVPCERSGDADSIICSVTFESASVRVSAPRRLSIRSRLRANVRAYASVPTATAIMSEVDPSGVYTRRESVMCLDVKSAVSDELSLSYSTPQGSEDTRVVSAEGAVLISACEASRGAIGCKGSVALKLLCRSEESGEYFLKNGNVPFDTQIECDVDNSYSCRARGIISELSVSVTESAVECDVSVILEALACKNAPVEYTCDVYSVKNECECETASLSVAQSLVCTMSNLTFSERVPLSDTSIPQSARLVDSSFSAFFDKCALVDGKYVFTGNAQVCVLYESDGDIYSATVNIPTRYEAGESGAGEPVAFGIEAEATDVRVRLEGGELRVDAELIIGADCMGESEIEAVESASFGEEIAREGEDIVVCYPERGDTLWSVAKRYLVPPASVLGDPAEDRYVIIE